MDSAGSVLMIFAKAPEPGLVKSRLIPALGEEKAAEVYRSLMEKTLQTCRGAGFKNIQLWCYPNTDHPHFNAYSGRFHARLCAQRGNDLGERMWFALSQALTQYDHGIIVGCDCPDLCADDLITAVEKLEEGCDAVIGPSDDGGYYLLGTNQASHILFTDITWGTATVYSETMERIRELKLHCYELPEHYDVDRPEDLERYVNGDW